MQRRYPIARARQAGLSVAPNARAVGIRLDIISPSIHAAGPEPRALWALRRMLRAVPWFADYVDFLVVKRID